MKMIKLFKEEVDGYNCKFRCDDGKEKNEFNRTFKEAGNYYGEFIHIEK